MRWLNRFLIAVTGLALLYGCSQPSSDLTRSNEDFIGRRLTPASASRGRVVRSGSRHFHETREYDLLGRTRSTTYSADNVTYRYAFDFAFPGGAVSDGELGSTLTTTQFPDGEQVIRSFDAAHHLQQVRSQLLNPQDMHAVYDDIIIYRSRYNQFGQILWSDFGNGTREVKLYATTRQLSHSVTKRLRDGETLQAFGYQYDTLGRLQRVDDYCSWRKGAPHCCDPREQSCQAGEKSSTYAYAPNGTLSQVRQGNELQVFEVNALGNLTRKGDQTQHYSEVAHPHAVTSTRTLDGQETGRYLYNAVGAMTDMRENGVRTNFTWNAANMPISTWQGGRRTDRHYLGETLYKRQDLTEDKTEITYFLPALRVESATFRKQYGVAERESAPSESNPSARRGTLRFFHANHLASSTLVTNEEGLPIHQAVYAPFGEELSKTGSFSPKQTFSSKEKEPTSGLIDFGARLYHARIGRFISPDSIRDGLDAYAYVQNDPINRIDPTGHQSGPSCDKNSQRQCITSQEPNVVFQEGTGTLANIKKFFKSFWNNLIGNDFNDVLNDQLGRVSTRTPSERFLQEGVTQWSRTQGRFSHVPGILESRDPWIVVGGISAALLDPSFMERKAPFVAAKMTVKKFPGFTGTFHAYKVYIDGKFTNTVMKTMKHEVGYSELSHEERIVQTRQIVEATQYLSKQFPGLIPETIIHPKTGGSILQEYVRGHELDLLPLDVQVVARKNAFDLVRWTGRMQERSTSSVFKGIEIDGNLDNFRFDSEGKVLFWFDPVSIYESSSKLWR